MKTLTLILALLLPVAIYAQGMEGHGETPGFAVGTLAPIGSFEFAEAAGYTQIAMLRHQAQTALIAHTISTSQAQYLQNRTQDVFNELDMAMALCKQDSHTGKCTGDKRKANVHLRHARALLAKIHVGDSP